MQFTGHSLPVHQSMSVSWDFNLVPFHQPNPPTKALSITDHWNVSLPSGASLWNGMFGLAEGQNATVVCMLSARSLISKSSTSSTNPWLIVLRTSYTIGIIVIFMFCSFFFQFFSKVQVFIFLLAILQFYPQANRNSKVHYSVGSLFFFLCSFCWMSLDLVVWSRLGNPFTSQNPRVFCALHFPSRILGCPYNICSYDRI